MWREIGCIALRGGIGEGGGGMKCRRWPIEDEE